MGWEKDIYYFLIGGIVFFAVLLVLAWRGVRALCRSAFPPAVGDIRMDKDGIQAEFLCKCGRMKGWHKVGVYTLPCPECGRVYDVVHNPKTGSIKFYEVTAP